MGKSMREQLEDAFDQMDDEAGGPDEDTEESVGDTEEEEEISSSPDGDDAGAEEGDEGDSASEDEEEGVDGDNADEAGESESEGEAGDAERAAEPAPEERAPASWRPSAREVWKDLPPAAKEEVLKREREIQQGMEQASQARRFSQQFQEMVRPFEGIMRAEGARNPLEGIQSLLQVGASLSMGQKSQKAQTIANLIKHYGVDIETLDSVLAGEEPVSQEEDRIQRMLDERLKPVQDLLGQVNQHRQQQTQQSGTQVQSEIETFSKDPKNEFFGDVRSDMADILELAASRGQEMSLEEAYDRACYFNPEVRKVMEQRKGAGGATPSKADLRRKRAAASSVAGRRGGATMGGGTEDLRGALEDAWDQLQR